MQRHCEIPCHRDKFQPQKRLWRYELITVCLPTEECRTAAFLWVLCRLLLLLLSQHFPETQWGVFLLHDIKLIFIPSATAVLADLTGSLHLPCHIYSSDGCLTQVKERLEKTIVTELTFSVF